jgi:hypothetical protein
MERVKPLPEYDARMDPE